MPVGEKIKTSIPFSFEFVDYNKIQKSTHLTFILALLTLFYWFTNLSELILVKKYPFIKKCMALIFFMSDICLSIYMINTFKIKFILENMNSKNQSLFKCMLSAHGTEWVFTQPWSDASFMKSMFAIQSDMFSLYDHLKTADWTLLNRFKLNYL